MRTTLVSAVAMLSIAAVGPGLALAQEYPNKSIRFIVPFPPGGATDAFARTIGQKLNEAWGQPVVIDNRPGAGGNIGADAAAKSPADGYAIIIVGPSHGANISLYSKLSYDPIRDFTPITQVAAMQVFLVVHPSVPARSVKELITLARAKPGELQYGSGGNGSSNHLATELFKSLAKIDIAHVPYKGTESVIGILRGEVSLLFENLISVGAHIKSGKVRVLAVGGAKRFAAMPEVPTIAESGVPGYEMVLWYGVLAPAGTPKSIVAKLNSEMVKTLNLPDVRQRLSNQGAEAVGNTPEQFDALIKSEIKNWARVVKEAGLRVD
jgi:tripartite-type tricarboxylate transporter receptor subunit TctC